MNTCPYSYFEYKIGRHDTYASLSKKYRMTEQQLRDYNDNAKLLPGSSVKIPYASGGCQNGAFYALKSGETLEDIANQKGLSMQQLLNANPYLNPSFYVPGQIIVIPQKNADKATFVYTIRPREGLFDVLRKFDMDLGTFCKLNSTIDPEHLTPGQRVIVLEQCSWQPGKWYEIRPGDTPSSISEKFKVKLARLLAANQNLRPSEFAPGLKIRIPDS